ncbi:cupin domain-containing protein [Pedobacter cryophilus]|uniref:Cupin domain-containing protein n=1 Tax=Pedobacter cryophilus TaxID=2571271 RepID=A0A4U1C4Y7_9SPHI|nr:cupin domain-containing protein [Pedobacter cryophilus]TKC00966.1 cupin domain-containing protein [Pedobacter cryophilus]
MSKFNISIAIFAVVIITSCSSRRNSLAKSSEPIFPKGSKVSNSNFTGTVWLNMLLPSDTVYNSNIGLVTFEPRARTKWHYHQGGQILLVTQGKGLYQEKGKAIQVIQKGDVVKCPPNIPHWHGATAKDTMTHIAIGTNTNKGVVVWLSPVSEKEYQQNQ